MMAIHKAPLLHDDKNDSEVLVFYKGLGAAPHRLLPGRCVFKLLDLIMDISLDYRVRELRKASEAVTILTGMAGFLIFHHLEHSPRMEGPHGMRTSHPDCLDSIHIELPPKIE